MICEMTTGNDLYGYSSAKLHTQFHLFSAVEDPFWSSRLRQLIGIAVAGFASEIIEDS